MASSAGGAGAPAARTHALWAGVFLAVAGLVQTLIPNFFDGDTGYHLVVARLTLEHGVLQAFPWTPYSWLAERYADKELLFHWGLIPLAHLEPATAARIAGTLLGTALLLVLYALLTAERVPSAGMWTLLALASSSAFVVRFAMVRPHMLSIPLAMGVLWAAARGRPRLLFALCLLFPLCYTAWHLPVGLAVLAAGARFLADGRLDWRTPAVASAGLVLGIVVHPNFPDTAHLFWIQNFQILFGTAWAGATGVDLGGEFQPFSLPGLGRYVLWPGLFTVVAAVLAWRARREDALPLAVALAALGFAVLTLRTQRFIEYLAPFAALALALAVTRAAWPARRALLASALVVVGVWWAALLGRHPIELLRSRIDPFPQPVTELLQDIIPADAQVFTCGWRMTGEMMLALPERRFVVALDPVFLGVGDPERYRVWYETPRQPPEQPALLIRDTFEARYVLCYHGQRWGAFFAALDADPAAALRGVIGLWRVYELRPPEHDPVGRERRERESPAIAARAAHH